MKRGPKQYDCAQAMLPLQFEHLVACQMGKTGGGLYQKSNGRWVLRVTVRNANKKKVGVRLRIPLKTRCPIEAEARKDLILTLLKRLGATDTKITGHLFTEEVGVERLNRGPLDEVPSDEEEPEASPITTAAADAA